MKIIKNKPKSDPKPKAKKSNIRSKSKLIKSSEGGDLSVHTGIIERIFRKANFNVLDLDSNFVIHEDTAFTKAGYVRVYNIISYPESVPWSERSGFLSAVMNDFYNQEEVRGKVDLFFESTNKPYKIQFNKKINSQHENTLNARIRLTRALEGNFEDFPKNSRERELRKMGKDAIKFKLAEANKKINSYHIIKQNQAMGKTQVESTQFIRMISKTKNLLDIAENLLFQQFNAVDITISKVKDLHTYYETFSPISGLFNLNSNWGTVFKSNIFTSTAYSKIRNKPTRIMENELYNLSRLIQLGTDITNFEPVPISFTSTGNAQNIVIVGTSGSGKTKLFQYLCLKFGLLKFKLNLMDYKGGEYDGLLEAIPNSIKLDFSHSCDYHINMFKFKSEEKNKDLLKRQFADNVESLVKSLRILSGIEENVNRTEKLIRELVRKTYNSKKVYFDDPDTYQWSLEISMKNDFGAFLKDLLKDQILIKTYGEDVCKNLYLSLLPYFTTSDAASNIMTKELDVDYIISHDCIIYSYNMNAETPWTSVTKYAIFMQDFISNKFIQKNKKEGFTTINSLEEYQRAIQESPEIRKIYNNKLSGGRSDSVINVVITNTLASLLEKDNNISAIRENIATVFIGKIIDKYALKEFCEIFNLNQDMQMINAVDYLDHTFYVNYNTGAQRGSNLVRALYPQYLAQFLETKRIDRAGEFGWK